MKTIKLKTVNENNCNYDVSEYCYNYSGMFRELYANFELSEDKNFQREVENKYDLNSWFYVCCKIDVESKIKQNETRYEQHKIELEELEKELFENKFEEGKYGRRRKFNVMQKIKALKLSIGRDITFGSRELLQRISFLSNPISKHIIKDKTEDEIKELEEERLIKLKEAKEEYQDNRMLYIYSIGNGDKINHGNRKYGFDLINKKVIFKPEFGIKIPIEFYCSDDQHKELCRLQAIRDEIPITVQLNNEYVCLIYDEEKLNGYAFNKKEYYRELKTIPKENKAERKECGKKWAIEQKERMLVGKNPNRWIAFDLNPEYIGFSILHKIGEKDFKIIHKECISFENLNIKLGLSTEDAEPIKQNNKRIHELYEAWKYIFDLAKHFGVAYCSIENLDFEKEPINEKSKEANRITKNLWHRTKTTEVVKKYCAERGIKLVPVATPYSTLIGNIKYNYFDPVNASIEIGRRGITKYLKGLFYPPLERSDIDTMSALGLDVRSKTISTWVDAYKLFKTAGLRYRRDLQNCKFVENNLYSHKSKVKKLIFCDR